MDSNIPRIIPPTLWPLDSSRDPDFRAALQSRGLTAHDVDECMGAKKNEIFNRELSRSVQEISPQILPITQRSEYVYRQIEPFLRIIQAPQGAATYNLIRAEFFNLHDVQGHHAEKVFSLIGATLKKFQESFSRTVPPKKEEWAELDRKVESIQGTWPELATSWRHVIQSQRNREGVEKILFEWNHEATTKIQAIVETVNLIFRTVLQTSEEAFKVFVRKTTQRLTSKCHFCQKMNPFSPQEAFVQTMSKCARCRSMWYCSAECQRKDWPEHKLICRPKR